MLFVCQSKILHKHCLQYLLGVKMAPRETENNDKQRALWYVMVFSGAVNCLLSKRRKWFLFIHIAPGNIVDFWNSFWKSHNWIFLLHEFFSLPSSLHEFFFLAFSLAWIIFCFFPHRPPPATHHSSNGPSLNVHWKFPDIKKMLKFFVHTINYKG